MVDTNNIVQKSEVTIRLSNYIFPSLNVELSSHDKDWTSKAIAKINEIIKAKESQKWKRIISSAPSFYVLWLSLAFMPLMISISTKSLTAGIIFSLIFLATICIYPISKKTDFFKACKVILEV